MREIDARGVTIAGLGRPVSMSNERTIWNIYVNCISGALEAARDGEVRGDLEPRNWVYSTTAPVLMTEAEAKAWANALANLGKVPEPQRKSTSSTWRTDVPLAADSPILLCGTDGALFVLSWREYEGEHGWEADGRIISHGYRYTHTDVADMVNDGKLKWRPLDLGGGA